VDHAVHLLQEDGDTVVMWLRKTEWLHRKLRPNLPIDYAAYLGQMFVEGARMAVLHFSGEPKALAVYRVYHTTYQGLRFYVDDLVTDEGERGRGLGATLIGWCKARARAEGCDTLALDSGVQRSAAHRFYFRHGLTVGSFGFNEDL